MTTRWLLALALSGLLSACGSGGTAVDGGSSVSSGPASSASTATATATATATPSPAAAPRTLTPADDGQAYSMTVGQVAELVVADPDAPDPRVEGTSVEVIPVVNITASGRREWELRAVAPGRTTIAGAGSQPYRIVLEVLDGPGS